MLLKTAIYKTVSPNRINSYYYVGAYAYRNDALEFISRPEGRLPPFRIDTTKASVTVHVPSKRRRKNDLIFMGEKNGFR